MIKGLWSVRSIFVVDVCSRRVDVEVHNFLTPLSSAGDRTLLLDVHGLNGKSLYTTYPSWTDTVLTKGWWPFCKQWNCRWPWPKSLRKNATCRALRLFQPRHGWGSFWSRKCRTGKRLAPDDTMFSCIVRLTETTHESFGKFCLAKNMGPVQQKESPDFGFEWSNLLLAILAHRNKKSTQDVFSRQITNKKPNRNIESNHPHFREAPDSSV